MRPLPVNVPLAFGDSSPNRDSSSLSLPGVLRRFGSKVGITGGVLGGYIGTEEFGRKRIEDNWPV